MYWKKVKPTDRYNQEKANILILGLVVPNLGSSIMVSHGIIVSPSIMDIKDSINDLGYHYGIIGYH